MSARIDKLISAGLLLAVVFTTLAYGTVEAWSVAIFEMIVIALILLWGVKVTIDKRVAVRIPQAALPIAVLLAIGLAQSVALTGNDGRRLSLSIDVEATRVAATVLFYLLASFIIAANFFNHRRRLKWLSKFIVFYGLALAVFALAQHFAWDGRLYWLRPNTQTTAAFGPFASHNHFAGYLELLIPMPVALIVTRAARGEMRLFYGFAASVMIVALIASLSRGGMISLVAAMCFIAVMSLRRGRKSERKTTGHKNRGVTHFILNPPALLIVVVATLAVGIFWIGPGAIVDRVMSGRLAGAEPDAETFFTSRGWIWRDAVSMFLANPITGVGMGAFQTAYPIYSLSDGALTVSHAHNDYLQAATDCGIPGAAVALWFIVAIFRAIGRGVRSGDPLLRGLALGSGAAIFAMLVHSLLDFNLQLPSNALMFLLLSAVASHIGSITNGKESSERRRGRAQAGIEELAKGVSS